MSIIGNFIDRNFKDPVVFARIAKMLRDGAKIVKVRHRNHETRYYTGTGERYGSGRGKRARWMMDVTHFEVNAAGVEVLTPAVLPWMDQRELDLLLQWDCDNVYEFATVSLMNHTPQALREFIVSVGNRLKPHQGYSFGHFHITNDLIVPGGMLFREGSCKHLIPDGYLPFGFGGHWISELTFDPKNVFVANEDKIKRQHRPTTDLSRWIVLEEVHSVDSDWVIRYTSDVTAETMIRYYKLKIDIDLKSMKGHPFYITQLLNHALTILRKKNGNGYYDLDDSSIIINWDGKSERLHTWLDRVDRYPVMKDEAPVVIFHPLVTRATYNGYYSNCEFKEI